MSDASARAGWRREPLLHFLVIGLALFALYRVLNPGSMESPREIVVTQARVEAIAENFARTWSRPPTPEELRGLVSDYVAEEVYYREAMAMGLDRDDIVIRRRLRQKMEFISADVAAAETPTDAQLADYLARHPDDFRRPPTYTFQQVYFDSTRRGDAAASEATQLLGRLQAGGGVGDAGDSTLLPPAMEEASTRDIENTFGSEFAAAVAAAPVGQWFGPVQTTFGTHLLRVDASTPGELPSLADARVEVARAWESEQRRIVNDRMLESLRSRYQIRIEAPDAASLPPGQQEPDSRP
ncbi:MAG: peptidylprolyl isomerase [Steroidobacteraceae bacterium]|nr:peptidylprolyl isomerase [Steroidobacteraceae bacterium]